MGEFGPEVVRLPSPWAADTARWSGLPRPGIDPGCIPDLPGGGDVCLVAKSGELAVDEAISPGRVSVDRPQDQRLHSGGDAGTTRPNRRGSPAVGAELPVPAREGGGRGD